MKVTVIKQAFYRGSLREVGAEVDVPEGFKASWFAGKETEAAKATKVAPKKQEPQALSELGNAQAKSFSKVMSKTDLA